MQSEAFEWVEAGTPMQALEAMCRQVDVPTDVFHRVYERILADEALLTDSPGAIMFLEQLLHCDGPQDLELVRNERISTVTSGEDLGVPDAALEDEIGYDLNRRRKWVADNDRNLPGQFAFLETKNWNQ